MSDRQWKFVHQHRPDDTIVVAELRSAQLLESILRDKMPGEWTLREEDLSEGEAAPATEIPAEPPMEPASPPVLVAAPALAPIEVGPGAPPPIYLTERQNGKRRFERFAIPFRLIIVSGERSFRTYSGDISLGGMSLQDPFPPQLLREKCTVFIGSKTAPENIELQCSFVGDPGDPCRVMFRGCDPVMLRKLEAWILAAKRALVASAA
jgi:hypothetical protein